MSPQTPQTAPSGIGGWLLLVAVGVCLTVPRMAVTTTGTRAAGTDR